MATSVKSFYLIYVHLCYLGCFFENSRNILLNFKVVIIHTLIKRNLEQNSRKSFHCVSRKYKAFKAHLQNIFIEMFIK